MICVTVYFIGYGFELSSTSLKAMLFWSKIQYLGIPFIPVFHLILSIRYTGKGSQLKSVLLFGFFVIPVITVILHYTSSLHNLFYINPRIEKAGVNLVLAFDRGIWYMVQAVYANILLILGIIYYAVYLIRASVYNRRQTIFMLLGAVISWVVLILYLTEISPENIDIMPFALAVSGIVYALGIARYKFFNILPVAREFVFESVPDGIIVFDQENRVIDINSAAKKLFPGIPANVIGSSIDILRINNQALLDFITDVSNTSEYIDMPMQRDDDKFWVRVIKSQLKSSELVLGKIFRIIDITEEKLLLLNLQEQASFDDLTKIFNRRRFLSLARQELSRSHRYRHAFSFILFDLDYFKDLNDNYGHTAGDTALIHCTQKIRESLRDTDIFGRYGGEEFAIVLPETSLSRAAEIAERIRSILETSVFDYNENKIRITASFGVTGAENVDNSNLDPLIETADQALYLAKNSGRNQVKVVPSHD